MKIAGGSLRPDTTRLDWSLRRCLMSRLKSTNLLKRYLTADI